MQTNAGNNCEECCKEISSHVCEIVVFCSTLFSCFPSTWSYCGVIN